jgi:hypothetical protein
VGNLDRECVAECGGKLEMECVIERGFVYVYVCVCVCVCFLCVSFDILLVVSYFAG